MLQVEVGRDSLNGPKSQTFSRRKEAKAGARRWPLPRRRIAIVSTERGQQLELELDQLAERIAEMDRVIHQTAGEYEGCRRMLAIPGIGPVTATAIVAAIGSGQAFGKGRDFAAWIGLVPGEHSTGGKQRLLGISKRGNPYLRKLFVQGARAVLQKRSRQTSGLSCWLERLVARKHGNVAVIALANKLARMAWAVLAKDQPYRPPVLASAQAI
jgi:transposase